MYRDLYISGTNIVYRNTRSFREAINANVGGSGRWAAEALVNTLGKDERFLKIFRNMTVSPEKRKYRIPNTDMTVVYIKESPEDVVFITALSPKPCYS